MCAIDGVPCIGRISREQGGDVSVVPKLGMNKVAPRIHTSEYLGMNGYPTARTQCQSYVTGLTALAASITPGFKPAGRTGH